MTERSTYDPIEAVNLVNDMLDALDFGKSLPVENPERFMKRAVDVIGKMQDRIEELDDYYKP